MPPVNATISLVGVGGGSITLSNPGVYRPEGVSLKSVPAGLSGWGVENVWEEYTGLAAATYRGVKGGVEAMTLELQARGANPREHLNAVMDLCAAGPVKVVVTTPDYGDRFVVGRLRDVSKITWHGGGAYDAVFAEASLILDIGRPMWQCADQQAIFTPGSTTWGDVRLETIGDQPFWPRFTITGKYANLQLRLSEADEWQALPWSADGWVIDTNPATRGVRSKYGEYSFAQVVPFWPEPVQVVDGLAYVQIVPVSAQQDFRVLVEWTPEAKRAW